MFSEDRWAWGTICDDFDSYNDGFWMMLENYFWVDHCEFW
jgi:hypothetical protein